MRDDYTMFFNAFLFRSPCGNLKCVAFYKKAGKQFYGTQIRHLLTLKLQIHLENQIRLQSICVHNIRFGKIDFIAVIAANVWE